MRNNRVVTLGNMKVFQEVVFPASKRRNCVKNTGRGGGRRRKVCPICLNSDMVVAAGDERNRNEYIGDCSRTGFL